MTRQSRIARAVACHQSGNLAQAERLYRAALRANPAEFDALHLLGVLEAQRGRLDEAHRLIGLALVHNPRSAQAQLSQGNVLSAQCRFEEALARYERALAINPDLADANQNSGNALQALGRNVEALGSYDRALAISPTSAAIRNNRGIVLGKLDRHEEALESFDGAIAMEPGFADAHVNRGQALEFLGRCEEAAASFERALGLRPDFHHVAGMLRFAKMQCCDWSEYEPETERLIVDVRASRNAVAPLPFLGISGSAQDQRRCAESWVRNEIAGPQTPLWRGERYAHDRIRLAYLSADFHDHAMAYLMAGLFERHDRARFETIAVSLGPDVRSAMRSRLEGAFERFFDVGQKDDREIANLLRSLEIDILVDLNGFTRGSRAAILALRPAPVQVNYLGYPGTMGWDCIDYILADRFVIPEQHRIHFAERVVYLPDTFQANDSGRHAEGRIPTRAEAGLPERGFVFCSFNNGYKITPAVFDVWMRLLGQVEESALWLVPGNEAAERNLRREGSERGINPGRIIFARSLNYADHLARIRLADLFLDTLPFNAGATASDALWAGLPVLICTGEAFAARMAGSLLTAIGAPELITRSREQYEALALKLATDREMLSGIRAKLDRNRLSLPLFDTDRFRAHIEAAYTAMWERCQRGKAPEGFEVEPMR